MEHKWPNEQKLGPSKGLKTLHLGLAAPYLKFLMAVKDYAFLWDKNINEFSVTELYIANWKLV